jgi:hypothetical protein
MTCINCKFPRKKYHLDDDDKCLYSPGIYQVRGHKRNTELIDLEEYELGWGCGCCGSIHADRLRVSVKDEFALGCLVCKASNLLKAPFLL